MANFRFSHAEGGGGGGAGNVLPIKRSTEMN